MIGEFSGRLRARVALSRSSDARDALGAADGGWIENGTAWGSVEFAGHGALAAGNVRTGMSVWRVTLRPCDVRVGDMVDWGNRAMIVRVLEEDPALPDRIVAIGEQCR